MQMGDLDPDKPELDELGPDRPGSTGLELGELYRDEPVSMAGVDSCRWGWTGSISQDG